MAYRHTSIVTPFSNRNVYPADNKTSDKLRETVERTELNLPLKVELLCNLLMHVLACEEDPRGSDVIVADVLTLASTRNLVFCSAIDEDGVAGWEH